MELHALQREFEDSREQEFEMAAVRLAAMLLHRDLMHRATTIDERNEVDRLATSVLLLAPPPLRAA